MIKKILEYIEKLKTESFEGWSKKEKNAYLTACISVEKRVKRLKNIDKMSDYIVTLSRVYDIPETEVHDRLKEEGHSALEELPEESYFKAATELAQEEFMEDILDISSPYDFTIANIKFPEI